MRLQEIVVEVRGLNSGADEQALANALAAVPGVHDVRVESNNERVVVTGDPLVAVPELLRATIVGANFKPGEIWFAE